MFQYIILNYCYNKVMKNILRILAITAGILLIPLIAMQFTDEVNWTLSDFMVVGVGLIGFGLMYELFVKKIANTQYRTIAAVVLTGVFLLLWVELAVGILGTPLAGN